VSSAAEAIAQRLHDLGIDRALTAWLDGSGGTAPKVGGVLGSHATARDVSRDPSRRSRVTAETKISFGPASRADPRGSTRRCFASGTLYNQRVRELLGP
jgi:hypothetical protein